LASSNGRQGRRNPSRRAALLVVVVVVGTSHKEESMRDSQDKSSHKNSTSTQGNEPAQLLANEADATRHLSPACPGPRTPLGKQKSKYNRLGHTIFARFVLAEEEADYTELRVSFRKARQPVGGLEEFLVEKLAFVALRKGRVYKADAKVAPLLFDAIRKGLTEKSSPTIVELVNRKDELAMIRRELSPELLLRYETSLERQFDRILTQLERLQRRRLGQPVPPPVKVELS